MSREGIDFKNVTPELVLKQSADRICDAFSPSEIGRLVFDLANEDLINRAQKDEIERTTAMHILLSYFLGTHRLPEEIKRLLNILCIKYQKPGLRKEIDSVIEEFSGGAIDNDANDGDRCNQNIQQQGSINKQTVQAGELAGILQNDPFLLQRSAQIQLVLKITNADWATIKKEDDSYDFCLKLIHYWVNGLRESPTVGRLCSTLDSGYKNAAGLLKNYSSTAKIEI